MTRRQTWQQLEKRAAKAKARETYLEAQKLNPVAKPYKAKGDTDTVWAYSFEDESIIVSLPVLTSTITKITPALAALGILLPAAATALTGVTRLNFEQGHKQILRATIHEGKVTPTPKNTPWGTRVVDMIDNSYSFPFSLGTDNTPTLKEAKLAFYNVMSGALATAIAKENSYATLSFRGEVLAISRG